MKAEIRALLGGPGVPGVDLDDQYVPPDPDNVGLVVQALLGPEGEPGMESFQFLVRTPRYLAEEVARSGRGYLFARHYLILERYSYERLLAALQELLAECTGPDWDTVATRLARYGLWEFEDYQEYDPQRRGG